MHIFFQYVHHTVSHCVCSAQLPTGDKADESGEAVIIIIASIARLVNQDSEMNDANKL